MTTKKKLPKAIVGTGDDIAEAEATPTLEETPSPAVASGPVRASPVATADLMEDDDEILSGSETPSVVDPIVLPKRSKSSADRARHRFQALRIVERYSNYCAAGGTIPLPVVNMAAVMAIIVQMVRLLSRHYGVPFERDRARAIVSGLIGGVVPTGIGTVTASTLFFVLPGSYLMGLAVSSVTAAACCRRVGRTFVDHFECGSTLTDFPAITAR